jgi:hypothetical protein
LNMPVNFLLLIHNWLSWVTYIHKVVRFIIGDTIVSVTISTRQDENYDEATKWRAFRVLSGFSFSELFGYMSHTIVNCVLKVRNLPAYSIIN